jgi:hypothetical protein
MKIRTASFIFFPVILFICAFQFTGCQSPKKTAQIERTAPVIQEIWEAISNRWGAVPIEKIKQAAGKGEVTAQYYLMDGSSTFSVRLTFQCFNPREILRLCRRTPEV